MKQLKYILSGLALCILFIFNSCTDLTETPYTFIDPGSFYKNEEQLNAGLTNVYKNFRSMMSDYTYTMRIEECTELGQPCQTKENGHYINCWYDINNASSSTFSNVWKAAYVTINSTNTVLARGENVTMNDDSKAAIFAQARFLRAYTYFILVRLYGGVPIPETFTSSLDGLEIPRESVETVYDYIITDLEYCESILPTRGTSSYEVWRVSKGAVQALFSEVYLTLASMEDNNSYYQKCIDYSEKVIKSDIYDLVEEYTDLWYAFNANAKNNKESIFELQFSAEANQANWCHQMFGFANSFTIPGYGYMYYHRFGPSIYTWESYDAQDERLDVFVTKFTYNGTDYEFQASDNGYYPGVKNWVSATPGNAKFYDYQTSAELKCPAANMYMLRYSEILLNYAEAKNKLGDTGEALKKLNLVHERSGLTALSSMNQEDLDEAIFQERAWEFIGEAKFYYDALRTNRLGKRLKAFMDRGVADGMYLFQDLMFVPQKSFLWKIPQGDLDSNPALEQNPDNVSDPNIPLR
ncbi:hypothetical protein GGR06_003609 [Bacteroides reticulotermitis]|uniref:RagB/SusD family nutrient uptake outer membrane protein n=2 Tax=Bacteroides reticulotermitis TaxID=1133319 RepID=A0A840D026_9BACE|nr:RagB/SusD family nutrient uptake outer membrane protein [Bacteroides reticulotermitis]MBB4045787.1 hypothetical protein [Bacteroides reticulotermitis]